MAKAPKELKNPWLCPECGREFSLQGRSGHLRFVHNIMPSQISAFLENATTPVAGPAPDLTPVKPPGVKLVPRVI